jgi:hypothetical protein
MSAAATAGLIDPDMKAEDCLGLIKIPDAFIEHQAGATFLSRRWPFFGRLKNKHDRPCQFIPDRAQDFGSAQRHGHMRVMSTSVHDAGFLIIENISIDGGKFQSGLLCDGQAIHIGTNRNKRPGLSTPEHRDYAGSGNTRLNFQPHVFQNFRHPFRGLEFTIAQFGVLVKPPSPLNHLRLDLRSQLVELPVVQLRLKRGDYQHSADNQRVDQKPFHCCTSVLLNDCPA